MFKSGLTFIIFSFFVNGMIKNKSIKNDYEMNLVKKLILYFGITLSIISIITFNINISDITASKIIVALFIVFIMIFKFLMNRFKNSIKVLDKLSNND